MTVDSFCDKFSFSDTHRGVALMLVKGMQKTVFTEAQLRLLLHPVFGKRYKFAKIVNVVVKK